VPLLCYFDAFSGISGDMLVGALADAGASEAAIAAAIGSMEIGAQVSFEKVKRRGIGATKFHVQAEETKKHRHLPHILRMIEAAEMAAGAKRNAARVFQKLGEAEASVHRVPIEKVHFHEVGAADSIADIVGACLGLELLGVTAVACSAVNVGSGTVQTEHGVLPVPAPATAALLAGHPVYARGPELELTTPTGAAVAATLATCWGTMPPLQLKTQGYGAGGHDFAEHANVLRILIGEPSGASEATTVTVIEANLDDANPQVLAFAAERLFERGALDVTLQPIVMKKGRPGTLLRVLARPEDRETLARTVFAETTTFGLRLYEAERRVQSRDWVEVETRYGTVRVKVSGDGAYAPEYEDCRKLAMSAGAPLKDVIAAANHAYLNRSK
jgi:pyridinium-3,5-bisthiocarboxylic acid mononucleotide nickel chelatase